MGLFDIIRSGKGQKNVCNDIGEFAFTELEGTNNFKGTVNSKIGQGIELLFPVNTTEISHYQTEYFREIESNWSFILKQLKSLNSKNDFELYSVTSILIPEKESDFYDMDAEIVFQKGNDIISIILSGLSVDEIIEI